MKKSFLGRAAALVSTFLLMPASASAQDRDQFRNQARQAAEQMRSTGEPRDRCSFGGTIMGGVVIETFASTPLQVGDRFISFNGTVVESSSDEQVIALARAIPPNSQIPITVRRADQVTNLHVTCGNARAYMQPLLTALDQAARGRVDDCVRTLNSSGNSDLYSLRLKLQCAALTNRPEAFNIGDIAYQVALKAVQVGGLVPAQRPEVIRQLRAMESPITQARGTVAFRELIEATRQWPGDQNAWERSEPDWALFRRNSEAALRRRLIDPDSARIEWPNGFLLGSWRPLLSSRIEGYWTCGLINARNRMGGYTGSTAFVVVLSPEGDVRHVDMGSSTGNYDLLGGQCSTSARLLPPPPPALADSRESEQAPAPTASLAEELERLVRLRDSGALTEAEFEAAKSRLLGQPAPDASSPK